MTLAFQQPEAIARARGDAADIGFLLKLGAIAEAAEAVAMYAEAAFDFAVDGDVPALAIAVDRIGAYAELMSKNFTEISEKRNFA
jgi:hypothetical protein